MSNEKKKEEKRTFLEYLAIKEDINTDIMTGDVYMELRGRNSLLVKGCRRILGYSPDSVVLDLKKDKLTVKGKRLICTSFYNRSVSVEGVIISVAFGGEEEE